jgi:sensor histidine kinase YesM
MNPLFLKNKNFVYFSGMWTLLAGVHTAFLYYVIHLSIQIALIDSFTSTILFMLFSIGMWFIIKGFSIISSGFLTVLKNHVFTAVSLISIWLFISYYFLSFTFESKKEYTDFLFYSLPVRAFYGMLLYSIIVMIYYLINTLEMQKEQLMREAELNRLVRDSELSLLKAQINPHFLFNSLNSIASLTLFDAVKAHEMIIELSDFLRYTIRTDENEMHRLPDELENIRRYMNIEKIRFGNRLQTTENIHTDCKNMMIPNMMLQPLYENAIKHGVNESTGTIHIELNCYPNGDTLIIQLRNNFSAESVSRRGKGLGIKNIKRRLEIYYKQSDLLTISKTESAFEVELKIPQKQL